MNHDDVLPAAPVGRLSRPTRRSALLGGVGLMGLGLAACSDAGGAGASGGDDPIIIGYLPPWTDTTVMAFLLKRQLEALGAAVQFETFTDAAVAYTALANGDIDIYSSSWPDVTHAEYIEEYGDSFEDLVTYNANATNMLAVPEYTDISTIEELAASPEQFDGRIVGIEPGAGLTGLVQDSVIPEYGLDENFELVTSSTPAMLTELQSALDAEEDIVVTLWRPFWANLVFPVRALEDPLGAFGEPETMHVMAREGFTADFADAADYIGRIELTDEEYEAAENLLVNEFEDGQEAEAIDAWAEQNPDVLPPVDG